MRRTLSFFFLGIAAVVGSFFATLPAFAIGSGSGGYVPPESTCSQDTWTCTGYSACSSAGIRTRTCTLKEDCAGVSTPKPTESQSCTPPAVPASGNADGNGSTGQPTSTNTAPPLIDGLRCGNLATTKERISCRLQLTPEQLVVEQQTLYLPEECRTFPLGSIGRASCVARYKSFAPCWTSAPGEPRFSCAKGALKIKVGVSEEIQICKKLMTTDVDAGRECLDNLRAKTFDMIKFRFYDLEKRAEDLLEKGATIDQVADFITFITDKKVAFNAATTDAARRTIILEVRDGWKQFLVDVKAGQQ